MTTAQKQLVGVAVASLVLGILGMVLIGPLGSIPAVICGHLAKSRIKANPAGLTGDGMALAGLILGYMQIGLMVVIFPIFVAVAIPSFVKAKEKAQQAACLNNLRQLEMAKEMAATEKNLAEGTELSEADLAPYLGGGVAGLVCRKGGQYTIAPIGASPSCSVHPADNETAAPAE